MMNKNFSHFSVVMLLMCCIIINRAPGTSTNEARLFGRFPLFSNDNNYCDTTCGKQKRFALFSILKAFCQARCPNSVVANIGNSNSGSSTTAPNPSQANINNIMQQLMQQMSNPAFGTTGGVPNFSVAPSSGNGIGQPQITFGNQQGNGVGQITPNQQTPTNGAINTVPPASGAPAAPGTSPAAGAPAVPAATPAPSPPAAPPAPAATPAPAAPAGR